MTIAKIPTHHQRLPFAAPVHQARRVSAGPGKSFATLLGQPGPPPAVSYETPLTVIPDQAALIPLGKIDRQNPTVSHLLAGDTPCPQAGRDIIAAKVNRDKPFMAIKPGTVVYLNPTSQELVWSAGQKLPSPFSDSKLSAQRLEEGKIEQTQTETKKTVPLIPLGTIDAEHPTLSHVLKSSPAYSDNVWEIIFSAANHNKPYTSLRPGCLVSIDPQTLELSFAQDVAAQVQPSPITSTASSNLEDRSVELADEQGLRQFAGQLATSVRAYIGQPYQKIDCYALVVQGLKDQGVQYGGVGGLRNSLEQIAGRHGLPANAYQNGEGLIEIAGHKRYSQSFGRINDVDNQTAVVMAQLRPLLQEGMLLSFSTPSQGHTGVIAKQDGEWTYINSGVIDHQVNGEKITKRVGEERLEAEIKNWFVLAKNKRTSLQISGGMFDPQKLKAAGKIMVTERAIGHESEVDSVVN